MVGAKVRSSLGVAWRRDFALGDRWCGVAGPALPAHDAGVRSGFVWLAFGVGLDPEPRRASGGRPGGSRPVACVGVCPGLASLGGPAKLSTDRGAAGIAHGCSGLDPAPRGGAAWALVSAAGFAATAPFSADAEHAQPMSGRNQ
eukprot:CAMPEP_0174851520 /NCGR_PEP_ID=MMETSP1114-20130205/23235_1 /TAXON_ID=312471 /ORGANISM="Neobodo designis, Strain CCAP 1951/1" /LENGTH=143 /DNA_ID=CAMNT_0016086063 /DNA_START=596 /DNA_END=1027 /DNA_ORIENTATION=+